MTMCMPHWNALRAAIDARGMGVLVAENGEAAARNLARVFGEDGGVPTLDSFDPLMGAWLSICGNALHHEGPLAVAENACPLCYLNDSARKAWQRARNEGNLPGVRYPCDEPGCEGHVFPDAPPTYDDWIDYAANEQVVIWKSLA